jgi:hypothetical protein
MTILFMTSILANTSGFCRSDSSSSEFVIVEDMILRIILSNGEIIIFENIDFRKEGNSVIIDEIDLRKENGPLVVEDIVMRLVLNNGKSFVVEDFIDLGVISGSDGNFIVIDDVDLMPITELDNFIVVDDISGI